MKKFADRAAAGRALAADVVRHLGDAEWPLVLALPRGGVPVAAEVAAATGGELDIVVVRKIGAPNRPEFGVGAIAEDGPPVFDEEMLRYAGVTTDDLADTVARERAEVRRRIRHHRGDRPAPDPTGRVVVVVDDGLATGVTARAVLRWLRARRPRHLVLAVPVGARQSCAALATEADALLCLNAPARFHAVGVHYDDFRQLTDDDVDRILCAVAELPPPDEVRRRVSRGRPARFRAGDDWRQVADDLRAAFAGESLHVIASPNGITVLRLIDEDEARRLREPLHALVAEFRALATRLAAAYHRDGDADRLDVDGDTWWLHVHGEHCQFTSLADGTEADVHLDRPDLLDPGFLLRYAETSGRHAEIRAACVHGFHDMVRLLALDGIR